MNQKNPITNEFDYTQEENEILARGKQYESLLSNSGYHQLRKELSLHTYEAEAALRDCISNDGQVVIALQRRVNERTAMLRFIDRTIFNHIEAAQLLNQSQENA